MVFENVPATLTVELGALEDLHFPDEDIVKWVDGLACLLDVTAKSIRDTESIKRFQS